MLSPQITTSIPSSPSHFLSLPLCCHPHGRPVSCSRLAPLGQCLKIFFASTPGSRFTWGPLPCTADLGCRTGPTPHCGGKSDHQAMGLPSVLEGLVGMGQRLFPLVTIRAPPSHASDSHHVPTPGIDLERNLTSTSVSLLRLGRQGKKLSLAASQCSFFLAPSPAPLCLVLFSAFHRPNSSLSI